MKTLIVNVQDNSNIEQIISAISMIKGIENVTADYGDNSSDWDETNYLCSIPGMKEKLIEGMKTPREELISIEEDFKNWDELYTIINEKSNKGL